MTDRTIADGAAWSAGPVAAPTATAPPVGQPSATTSLRWLVDRFASGTPGVTNAMVVSADGLPLLASTGLDRAGTDQLGAVAAGLASLTGGASTVLGGGGVRQTVVEMVNGYLLVATIASGGVLAALTDAEADLGLVGYEIAVLADQVGAQLSPALRAALSRSPAL